MRTRPLRRLPLDFAAPLALALSLDLALAGAARAGDVTYPQLGTATTVQDTDLIATWRASGPLTKVQASVLEAYLQGKLSPLFLQPADNLSDLANAGTARANLGLGSAALASTGTSGVALCQLNANCAWTGAQTFQAKVTTGAPTSGGAMFNLPPGAAPSSPVNGDQWATSTSLFVFLNGAAQQIAFTSSNVASASQWQTARTESLTGDVTGSATGINGTGNWSLATTLAASGVGAGTYGNATSVPVVSFDAKGRATGAYNQAISYPSQLPSQSGNGGADLSTNGSNPQWSIRARAYFQGYAGSIGNVTTTNATITRIGTGCYEMAFTNPMPDAGFTFIGTAGNYNAANMNLVVVEADSWWGRSASSVGFCVMNGGNPWEGTASVNVSVEAN